jgi:hypothetical protein
LGRRINATVSIGAAWTVENVSADLVLADADAALYRAKAAGRNRVMLAEQPVFAPDSSHDHPAAQGDDGWTWAGVEGRPAFVGQSTQ